jgi:hypothetical protein
MLYLCFILLFYSYYRIILCDAMLLTCIHMCVFAYVVLFQERETFVTERRSSSSLTEEPLPISRLASQSLFKSVNFDDFRTVIDAVSQQVTEFKNGFNECVVNGGADAVAIATFVQNSNNKVEDAFHMFWTATFLHLLPQHVYHYREPQIVSCDVRGLLIDLLDNISCTADAVAAMRTVRTATGSSSTGDELFQLRHLTLRDFGANLSKLHANTNNLFQIFYIELLMNDTSLVFRNLLIRHSEVLENWRF